MCFRQIFLALILEGKGLEGPGALGGAWDSRSERRGGGHAGGRLARVGTAWMRGWWRGREEAERILGCGWMDLWVPALPLRLGPTGERLRLTLSSAL